MTKPTIFIQTINKILGGKLFKMHLRILQIKLLNFFDKNRERICVPKNAYAPLKHNYALRYQI